MGSAPQQVATGSDQSFNMRVRHRGQIHKYLVTQVSIADVSGDCDLSSSVSYLHGHI